MELRREDRLRIDRLTDALERVAGGLEKAVELAQEEAEPLVDPSPPACPVCHKENPVVVFNMPGGRGRLADFSLTVQCEGCDSEIYGLPLEMFLSGNLKEIQRAQKERKAGW